MELSNNELMLELTKYREVVRVLQKKIWESIHADPTNKQLMLWHHAFVDAAQDLFNRHDTKPFDLGHKSLVIGKEIASEGKCTCPSYPSPCVHRAMVRIWKAYHNEQEKEVLI